MGVPLIDTTVKSGESTFAPTWDIVTRVKSGEITPDQYTEIYLSQMRHSYKRNTARWVEVARMDRVAVACYCTSGKFCHRLILIDLFKKVCEWHQIPFVYIGELKT